MSSAVFTQFSREAARWAGHPTTFISSVVFILLWALIGPLFHFHDIWQWVITGTTIISFWMIFLIQNTQNRDHVDLHLKLDQIILSIHAADNQYIELDDLSVAELDALRGTILARIKLDVSRES